MEYSLAGPPSPPPTPEKFKKVLNEVIEISDDESKDKPDNPCREDQTSNLAE